MKGIDSSNSSQDQDQEAQLNQIKRLSLSPCKTLFKHFMLFFLSRSVRHQDLHLVVNIESKALVTILLLI